MSAKPIKVKLSALEQAEATLAIFQWSIDSGHPWLPGSLFQKSPGLDQHIKEALESWVEKSRPTPPVKKTPPPPVMATSKSKEWVNGG